MSSATTLITFDVDGTLVRTVGKDSNRLHKEAFKHAWQTVFNLDTDIDTMKHHGLTDPLILVSMLEHHGTPRQEAMAKVKDMEAAMIAYFSDHIGDAGVGLEILPGVAELLTVLRTRTDVSFGLVTGNLEPIGWGKMKALGIQHLFSQPLWGGFGSDFCSGDMGEPWRDRGEMVRLARQRWLRQQGKGAQVKAAWHVGDTPYDIKASQVGGAGAIGVLTGVHTLQDLDKAATGVDGVILENLKDTAAVMHAFGLH